MATSPSFQPGVGAATLVRVEGHRWAIETVLRPQKLSLGSITTTRSWHGWCRHVSLVNARLCHDGRDRHRAKHRDSPANDTPDLCGPPLYPLAHSGNPASRTGLHSGASPKLMPSPGRFGDEPIRARQSTFTQAKITLG
jgi:hypothetical protein